MLKRLHGSLRAGAAALALALCGFGGCYWQYDQRDAVLGTALVDPFDTLIPDVVNPIANPTDNVGTQTALDYLYGLGANIAQEWIDRLNPQDPELR
jgi:hypothetical protein